MNFPEVLKRIFDSPLIEKVQPLQKSGDLIYPLHVVRNLKNGDAFISAEHMIQTLEWHHQFAPKLIDHLISQLKPICDSEKVNDSGKVK